jgi:tetratricopeptide (TPR) repeat protein
MAANACGLDKSVRLNNGQPIPPDSGHSQSDTTTSIALPLIQEGQDSRSADHLQLARVQYSPRGPTRSAEDEPSPEFLALLKNIPSFISADSSSALHEKICHIQNFEKEFLALATKIMERANRECLTENDYKNLELVLVYIKEFKKLCIDIRGIEQEIEENHVKKVQQHAELVLGFEAGLHELQTKKMVTRHAQETHEQKLRVVAQELKLKEEEQKHKHALDLLKASEESRLERQQEPISRREQDAQKEDAEIPVTRKTDSLPPVNLKAPLETFIPRVLWIEKLEKVLLPSNHWDSQDPLRWIVLFGLGGLGKSELACYFANKYIRRYSFVCWIDCNTPEARQLSYKELAKILKITLEDKMSIDEQHQLIISRLEKCQFKLPWLLIFDNANNSIPRPQRGGFILVTSNQRDIWPLSPDNCLEMSVFTEDESLTLVKRLTRQNDETNMRSLVHALDLFPLAIDTAAAFICRASMPVSEYLTRISKARVFLEGTIRHPKSLLTTMEITLTELVKLNPLAFEWLNLAAHLNPIKVPKIWLSRWLARKSVDKDTTPSEWGIFSVLHNFSLIHSSDDKLYFSMHPLLQEIIRWTQQEKRIAFCRSALNLLMAEEEKIQWQLRANIKNEQIWLLHAVCITKSDCFAHVTELERGNLLKIIGLIHVFNNKNGLEWLSSALTELNKAGEHASPKDKAECLKGIGLSHYILRNFQHSLNSLNESLHMFEEFYRSNDHPEIIHCLVDLGIVELGLCNYGFAIDLFDKAIEKYKKNTSAVSDHHIARCLQNKAIAMEEYGCPTEAVIETFDDAIVNFKNVHSEHFNPLICLCLIQKGRNLAKINRSQEALEILHSAIKGLTEIFQGASHPLIAYCLTEIGRVLVFSQPREALKNLNQALTMFNDISDENNRHFVGSCLSVMAMTFRILNCSDLSLVCNRAVLKIHQDIFRNIEHTYIAGSMFDVGFSLIRLNRYEQALTYLKNALQIFRKNFANRSHVMLADCICALALNYYLLNQKKIAIEFAEESRKMYGLLKVSDTDPRVQLAVGILKETGKSHCIIV